ncbi:hypothetical protein CEK71_13095 [Methylovulum psychrotolerans]|uniref:DUF4154 domain-containing protein n=1 Tax=Methylovulum psychrotolerans TaxID=1704499 RepID=A0A1Z4C086_9GAMM|nr:hypothetical protein CEK71_13095 [Methylovulum psychrotolerans]POZ52366.1 hypothetical protein AADEFJLK_01848 [Methylovulum psychrotolerans]
MHPLFSYCHQRLLGTIIKTVRSPVLCLVFGGLLLSPPVCADDVEYKVKAGYLYNFTKFITWPPDTSAKFNLCIFGKDPFGGLIDPIQQHQAFDKAIKVIRLDSAEALVSISKSTICHILFISSAIEHIPVQDAKNVLIVGESENFALQGGMIGFVNEDGRIKLQINRQALRRSDLKVSAKLFEVADVIDGDGHD